MIIIVALLSSCSAWGYSNCDHNTVGGDQGIVVKVEGSKDGIYDIRIEAPSKILDKSLNMIMLTKSEDYSLLAPLAFEVADGVASSWLSVSSEEVKSMELLLYYGEGECRIVLNRQVNA